MALEKDVESMAQANGMYAVVATRYRNQGKPAIVRGCVGFMICIGLFGCYCGKRDASQDSVEQPIGEYQEEYRKQLQGLEEREPRIRNNDGTYNSKELGACDRQVQALIDDSGKDRARRRDLSREIARLLARKQANQAHEFNYVLLGSAVILEVPPEDPAIIDGLIFRVETYREDARRDELADEMAVMCISLLCKLVGAQGYVKTTDMNIDWNAWSDLKHGIESHRKTLHLDKEKGYYVLE